MSEHKQKHTLVIGGTRGMGRTLVKSLADEGHILSVIGRREPNDKDRDVPNIHHWTVDLLNNGLGPNNKFLLQLAWL